MRIEMGDLREPSGAGLSGVAVSMRSAAERGDRDAQLNLAAMCSLGRGVARDAGEAAKWLADAAAHGSAEAQYLLGVFCHLGWGIERNDDKARQLLELAAAQGQGDAVAQLQELGETA